jgi:hypothetical protein
MGLFDELVPSEEESVESIIAKLMEGDNIALKTEYGNPLNITRLSAIADWLQEEGMLTSATIIREFVKHYSENMVSHQRKGRGEIVKALQERQKEGEKSRWTGRELEEAP